MTIRSLVSIVLPMMLATESFAARAPLAPADEAAAFAAAGFMRKDMRWRGACDDPGSASYSPAEIQSVRDLNGDGRPEAVIVEGGTYCYGLAGQGFQLVSKQPDGGWALITGDTGFPNFLSTLGAEGWPDIEIGGPGFCFPVKRWNGREYVPDRMQYEGKACKAD